jgi:hypothetical protein
MCDYMTDGRGKRYYFYYYYYYYYYRFVVRVQFSVKEIDSLDRFHFPRALPSRAFSEAYGYNVIMHHARAVRKRKALRVRDNIIPFYGAHARTSAITTAETTRVPKSEMKTYTCRPPMF